ncbi:substrate-binding domain-containing protein (plasmid) [Pseudarthrobacter psychrotolerans]|uniref:Substrate-binding domain-containing protein n=1 Tax=Pseudarthrobacter psychrotolerans TaxID=2697569 RepID=A0A6P1NS64_9MICC|nr:LacI family DNA-binding transcriptional regulator [Pseudarthrobacter psychrotolerans]QHK22629.1 substrate-binding domain-containing protein [Pseudarthrobacter psychrotolerans]
MTATLTDVATRAGVSLATASRAFKDPSMLATDTRQRVMVAAHEVGYGAPAYSGSRTFGVVVPDLSYAVLSAQTKAIQNQAWHGRHRMVLADTSEDTGREKEILERMSRELDGIVLISPRLSPSDIQAAAGAVPLVIIDAQVANTPCVLMDVTQGLREAVEHLQALGHRKIVYVPGPATSWANARRQDVLVRLCAERDVALVMVGNQTASLLGGMSAAAAVVSSGATAVIAYNDRVALGVMSGIRDMGLRCPEDLSIVGIDDIDMAAVSEPGLTSVRLAVDRSGALALEMLLDLITGRPLARKEVGLESQLIVRRSTSVARPAT